MEVSDENLFKTLPAVGSQYIVEVAGVVWLVGCSHHVYLVKSRQVHRSIPSWILKP